MRPNGPLADVRVLDLTRGGGAAACVGLLRLLGAKVSRGSAAEAARRGPALAAGYDVVVLDQRPAEAAALGLEVDALLAPGRVVVSATEFGLEGPAADRAGLAAEHLGVDPEVAAALAGAHGAVAALGALRWARQWRRGVHVEVATVEVVAGCLGDLLPRARCPRAVAPGTARGGASSVVVLPCADGHVGLSAPTAEVRADLAALSGVALDGDDPVAWSARLGPWLSTRTRLEIFHAAQLWRLPVVPVLEPAEALDDAQCVARGVWRRKDGQLVACSPYRFTAPPGSAMPSCDAAGERSDAAVGETAPPRLANARRTPPILGGWRGRPGRQASATPVLTEWRGLRGAPATPPVAMADGPPKRMKPLFTPELGARRSQYRASRGARQRDAGGPCIRSTVPRDSPTGACAGTAQEAIALRDRGQRRQPLSGVRVLDLGMVWAGPYCGRLLAGLGAEVIKVEGPNRPDGTRPRGRVGCAGVFADLNRGKRSLVVDLASASGRELFLRLAGQADVVLESFSPRVMPNFGLDYADLARAHPRLLMVSLPAFGSGGPWANYVAYGSGLELATGLAPRQADGRPRPAPVAYLDYLAGAYAAAGVLAALWARERSGQGMHLEVAQREVACQVLARRAVPGAAPTAWHLEPAAIAADPHLAACGLFAQPPAGGRPCHHYARLPWRLHGVPVRRERAAPDFGADSRRVLRQVGRLAADEIEDLERAGVVGTPPNSGCGEGARHLATPPELGGCAER